MLLHRSSCLTLDPASSLLAAPFTGLLLSELLLLLSPLLTDQHLLPEACFL
jgi:hypothetical protein